jgi:RpiR family murPQ operon transcriptional repressor
MPKSSLSLKIEKIANSLTKNESLIANYLLDPKTTTNDVSVKNILVKTKTSFSTLYNFLNKIGYQNIKELILALNEEEYERAMISNYIDVENEEQADLSSAYIGVIKKNAENISIESIDNLLNKITGVNHVYLIGLGESGLICNEMNYRLTRFGISCSVIENESGSLITKVLTIKESDLLICVSLSGESSIIIEAAKIAVQKNVETFAITTNDESSLAKVCDETLRIYFPIEKSMKEYYVSSLLPAFYFVDLLSRRMLSLDGKRFEEFKDLTSELITKVVKTKD